MRLHEHQSKDLLERHGITRPRGGVAETLTEARAISLVLRSPRYVVKAQILAGERAPAGGILHASTPDGVETAAHMLLGRRLVTPQTGRAGLSVGKVLVEEELDIARTAYVALIINPVSGRIELIASPKAPVDGLQSAEQIEQAFHNLPLSGSPHEPGGDLADRIGALAASLGYSNHTGVSTTVLSAARLFTALDATLMEFSPLAELADGRIMVIDAKINIDDNALFRQPGLRELQDPEAAEPTLLSAHQNEVNYVGLDGDIGLVVNGAGLGLATLDMVVEAGGRPANFMDIRTGASTRGIADAIAIVLARPGLKVLLVNVHGGGLTRCDLVAEALGLAFREAGHRPPVVFRAAGNNADFARTVLANCGIDADRCETMSEAVDKAVLMAKAAPAEAGP